MSNLNLKYEHHLQSFWDGLQPGDLIAVASGNAFVPGVFRKVTKRNTKNMWVNISGSIQTYWKPIEYEDLFKPSWSAHTRPYSSRYILVDNCPEKIHYYDLNVFQRVKGVLQLPYASYTQSDSYHRVLPYPLEMLSAPEFQIYNHIRELMGLPPVKKQK